MNWTSCDCDAKIHKLICDHLFELIKPKINIESSYLQKNICEFVMFMVEILITKSYLYKSMWQIIG